jgi:hypothetical protein
MAEKLVDIAVILQRIQAMDVVAAIFLWICLPLPVATLLRLLLRREDSLIFPRQSARTGSLVIALAGARGGPVACLHRRIGLPPGFRRARELPDGRLEMPMILPNRGHIIAVYDLLPFEEFYGDLLVNPTISYAKLLAVEAATRKVVRLSNMFNRLFEQGYLVPNISSG